MTLATRAGAIMVALAILATPQLVSADTVLRSDGARVFESSHSRAITLRPLEAQVRDVHVFGRRASREPTQLYYEFDLPKAAAITSMAVRFGRTVHRATAIDAGAAIRMIPDADGGEPDLAMLREIAAEGDDVSRYQLVITPLDRGGVTVEMDWTLDTTFDGSRVSVSVPGRGSAGNLAKTRLTVRAKGDGPVRELAELTLDGAPVRPGATMAHPQRDGTLTARTVFGKSGLPLFRYESTPLDGDLSVLTVSGIAPPPVQSGAEFAQMVIIVDVSKSMGRKGADAAAQLAADIATAAPRGVRLEVLLFDRKVRPVFGKLAVLKPTTAGAILGAAAKAPLNNGSDLRAALERASRLLAAPSARRRAKSAGTRGLRSSAIVVISDGQAPISLTREAARAAIGDYVAENAALFAIELGVSAHPLPRRPGGALRPLVQTSGGRSWALWAHRTKAATRSIAQRLAPTPHTTAVAAFDGTTRVRGLGLPDHLEPGSGFVASVLWRGRVPASLAIKSRRGGKPASQTARRARKPNRARAAARLRAITAEDIAAVGTDRRELARAGLANGLVGRRWSLVIPDPASRFGRERLAFAKRWGTSLYRRAPSRFELGTDRFYEKLEALASKPMVAQGPSAGGALDRETIQRAIRSQLFRPIRHCYERELRNAKKLAGEISVRFEVSRAEVVSASIHSAPGMPDSLQRCVVNAAYKLKPPTVFGDSDTSYLIRYPFRLRRSQQGGRVERGPSGPVTTPLDTRDPLDGLD